MHKFSIGYNSFKEKYYIYEDDWGTSRYLCKDLSISTTPVYFNTEKECELLIKKYINKEALSQIKGILQDNGLLDVYVVIPKSIYEELKACVSH